MLEAGADEVYPSFRGAPLVRKRSDLATMQLDVLGEQGERDDRPPLLHRADGRGRRPSAVPTRSGACTARSNVWVNDASLLPTAPGVNPQGTVMALAIRNARRFAAIGASAWLSDSRPPQTTVITGASGWLGRALRRPAAVRSVATATAPARPHDGRGRALHDLGHDRADGHRRRDRRHRQGRHGGTSAARDRQRRRRDPHRRDHPSDGDTPVLRGQHQRIAQRRRRQRSITACDGWCTSRRTARSAPTRGPATRSAPIEPYHPYYGYGRSKMQAELAVHRRDRAGLDATIVRPPWFYGPFQPPRQTTFFRLVRAGKFPVVGDGDQRRSMVYIDNLVDGVIAAELTPGREGQGLLGRRRPCRTRSTRSSRPWAGR